MSMRFGATFAIATIVALLSWPALAANEATATGTEAAQPQQQTLSQGELDALVAPIALYPDCPARASADGRDLPARGGAGRPLRQNESSLKGDKLDEALAKQDWDASVKSLVATPTVLDMMNKDLDWTQNLGDAVLAQQPDVMDAIQRLRAKAEQTASSQRPKSRRSRSPRKPTTSRSIVIEPDQPRDGLRALLRAGGGLRRLGLPRLPALLLRACAWLGGRRRDCDRHSLGRRLWPSATPSGTTSTGMTTTSMSTSTRT